MTDLNALSSIEIVGLTLIGEARGESVQGIIAVGSVIRNRAINQHKTYHEVCLAPKQFSCWNENDPNRSMLLEIADHLLNGQSIVDAYLRQCMFVAKGIVEHDLIDNTHGAMNYMTSDLFLSNDKPSWALNAKNLRTIGNQIFFNV